MATRYASTSTTTARKPAGKSKSPKLPKTARRLAEKAKAKAPAADLRATLQAAVEHVAAQAPVTPGLDGDAGMPPEQIGELVKPVEAPARGKAKAKKAPAPISVVLDREPGRGWFHIVIDGERSGAVFKTTRKGVAFWAAETPDRALRMEGANRTAAVDAFVHAYPSRPA